MHGKILGHASEPLPLFLFDALVVSRVPLRPQYICTGGAHRERRRAIYGTWNDGKMHTRSVLYVGGERMPMRGCDLPCDHIVSCFKEES